jgi:hypothetical protein
MSREYPFFTGQKRTVESLTWYDNPNKIYQDMILSPGWDYKRNRTPLQIRDLALMTVLYIACARITEVLGGPVTIQGEKQILDPIYKDQFVLEDDHLWLRHLPVIKQKYVLRGSKWLLIEGPRDYPKRVSIPFFINEDPMNKFTRCVLDHLDNIGPNRPVFNITRGRASQIIKAKNPDWFCHYFRDMGLKFWKRYFKQDSFKLKRFSGHKRWSSLEKYMLEELF